MFPGDHDSYEARGVMRPVGDWDPGHRGQHQGYMELATGTDQRLSDMMPDIAMAGQYPVDILNIVLLSNAL